jgi:hypothetical protein
MLFARISLFFDADAKSSARRSVGTVGIHLCLDIEGTYAVGARWHFRGVGMRRLIFEEAKTTVR